MSASIKVFIVTYNSPHRINKCLESLFSTDFPEDGYVGVMSNHTNHGIENKYLDRIELFENSCRPDWGTGHLSRSWNQCIMHGFKDLKNPECDALMLVQDDTLFQPDWYNRALALSEKYDIVQQGLGDACMLMTPECVRKVGLWDERFCQSRHAADFFWRCIMYTKETSSFNDYGHHREWQPIGQWELIKPESRDIAGDEFFVATQDDNSMSARLMQKKYPFEPFPWTQEKIEKAPSRTLTENYIYYTYFEKDIYDLNEKLYII